MKLMFRSNADARRCSQLAAEARAEKLTKEERSAMARRAAMMRWWVAGDDDFKRIEIQERLLNRIIKQALEENNPDLALRGISVLGAWERLRLLLQKETAPKQVSPIDEDDATDTEHRLRLEDARRRRAAALARAPEDQEAEED